MKPQDVLKIIKQARKAGLESLEIEGLRLRFFSGEAGVRTVERIERLRPLNTPEPEVLSEESNEQTQLEDELASLQIDDPLAFEEMIVEREIELGRDEERE